MYDTCGKERPRVQIRQVSNCLVFNLHFFDNYVNRPNNGGGIIAQSTEIAFALRLPCHRCMLIVTIFGGTEHHFGAHVIDRFLPLSVKS